jgi:hypothetical protein
MARRYRVFESLAVCVFTSVAVAACGGGATDDAFTAEGVSAGDASDELSWPEGARLLAELRPGGASIVRFYETEDGIGAMGRLDDGDGNALPGTAAHEAQGLADLYEALAGAGTDPALHAKLVASDEAARVNADPRDLLAQEHAVVDALTTTNVSGDDLEISTRQSCAIQSQAFYSADAAAYVAGFCRTIDGLKSIHCEPNVTGFNDGWHRAKKYRADSLNQTLCNTALMRCNWRYTGGFPPRSHSGQFVATLGPRAHGVCTWNTSRGDMDFHMDVATTSGPEASHLCASVNTN